jgi:pimeloyl-ACP methyl ester carboxylesterase
VKDPTFILVHGAWSGSWCWRELERTLDEFHVASRSVNLPSARLGAEVATDLFNDAQHVAQAADDLDHVVLVGHSYGGAVISEAAPLMRGLQQLIYIAALVPNKGESAAEAGRAVRVRTELDDAIEVDGDYLRLNKTRARSALFGQCDVSVQEWAIQRLTTQTIASFRSLRTSDSTGAASLYIKCRSDRAIDPGLQNVMATRCDEHVELESDHSPFLSHPLEIAHAMLD